MNHRNNVLKANISEIQNSSHNFSPFSLVKVVLFFLKNGKTQAASSSLFTRTFLFLALMIVGVNVSGQIYYDMSSGNYSQNFNGITTLPTNFSLVGVLATGTIPVATRTTATSTNNLNVVGTSAAVGIDVTTSTRLVFLTTGTPANSSAIASDLNLDFTNRIAGNLSYDASTIFNSTGDRVGSLRLYYSLENSVWTELTGTNLPYVATNNVAGSGVVNIALPAALNDQATVKLRFYYHNGNANGSAGSRPRIGIDNVSVTSTSSPNITIDANDDGPSVYPYDYVSGGTTYKAIWTSNDLYMFINGANQSEPVSIYLDVDPNVPVNGGTDANGTLVGLDYDGYTTRPNLPFRADICIYAHNGYREIFRRNGANGWTSIASGNGGLTGSADDYVGNTNGQYASNDNGNGNGGDDRREFRVSWARLLGTINGGSIPASFNMMSYISYANGMYAQIPVENYNGNNVSGNSNGIVRYFTVPTTVTPIAISPFANNSFTQPLTATNNSFGNIAVYDFTMNSNGQQISRLNTGGDWTISNNLVVGAGTLFFGSGGSGYGNTTVGNVNVVGGTLNMDQTNKPMNVAGNVTIASGGAVQLSGTIGGDLNIANNWSNAGTFTPNNRLVAFNGIAAQTLTGTTSFDFLSLNNSIGLTLQAASPVTVNQTLALTNGKITLGANNLTVGSAGTITGFDAT